MADISQTVCLSYSGQEMKKEQYFELFLSLKLFKVMILGSRIVNILDWTLNVTDLYIFGMNSDWIRAWIITDIFITFVIYAYLLPHTH